MNASPGSWAASENELTEYMADSEELAWTALAKSSCFHIVYLNKARCCIIEWEESDE